MKRRKNKLSRLRFECLEDRRMRAFVGIDIQRDLFIDLRNDSGSNDEVVVSDAGSWWLVNVNDVVRSFAKSAVGAYIECYTGDGDDYFENQTTLMADVEGGNGNDHLIGGPRHDGLNGGAGNDVLEGRGADDLLYGESGHDWIDCGAGHDYGHGGTGNDTIYGNLGNDTLEGSSGDDTLWGYYGDDLLYGSTGNDVLRGEYGDDTLYGENGYDWLDGGSEDDYVHGGSENDTLYGGLNNDTLEGSSGHDVLWGYYGNDLLYGSTGNDVLRGEYGDDTLYGEDGYDWLDGGSENDYLHGGTENDTLYGGLNNDTLDGFSGNDVLYGYYGDDVLYGSTGDDQLSGEFGNDTMYGESGNDRYFFDADYDLASDIVYDSEGGVDTLDYSSTTNRGVSVNLATNARQGVTPGHSLTLAPGAAIENLFGGAGADRLFGNPLRNQIKGGAGNDYIGGDAGNDVIYGDDGHDSLYGEGDSDALYGGRGNDGLFGGIGGFDWLNGGSGADRFLKYAGTTAYVFDQSSADATIVFRDSSRRWNATEINHVDEALAVLHAATGNTRLLKTSWGGSITFWRQSGSDGASNSDNGHITFSDDFMDSNHDGVISPEEAEQLRIAVFHEIGHNWDNENPDWNGFLALSGWTKADQTGNPDYRRIHGLGVDASGYKYDGRWWYLTSAEFDSDDAYARTHPRDDFAETFQIYFMWRGDWPDDSDNDGDQDLQEVPTKIAFLENWLARLS
jgi:Ca2+-binding RTX toxin-like protein